MEVDNKKDKWETDTGWDGRLPFYLFIGKDPDAGKD